MDGGSGGTWDVHRAVPLKGIFFLTQAQKDRVEPMGSGEVVCHLVESVEQASWPMVFGRGKDEIRRLRLQRFNNIAALGHAVPCYLLHLSFAGSFWQEIERAISSEGSS